jgi:quercetin dioxygenase-like cupin family protein
MHAMAGSNRMILEHAIDGLPGHQFSVARVQYAPGEAGPSHYHTAPLVAYVVSGALRSRVAMVRSASIIQGRFSMSHPTPSITCRRTRA